MLNDEKSEKSSTFRELVEGKRTPVLIHITEPYFSSTVSSEFTGGDPSLS